MRPTNDPAATEQLQRIRDIARRAQVSDRQVHRWIAAGEFKAIKIGKVTRIAPTDYARFLASKR
jgi:predicted DNA-binding transcriptional regulator AlpA